MFNETVESPRTHPGTVSPKYSLTAPLSPVLRFAFFHQSEFPVTGGPGLDMKRVTIYLRFESITWY